MTLDLDTSTTNLLQEQTFVDWQNTWVSTYLDCNYLGTDSFLYFIADAIWDQTDDSNNLYAMRRDLNHITLNILPAMYRTNNVFKATIENQLNQVISQLDKLAGDDGNGNANINVNFQPIQQTLDQLKQISQESTDHLRDISNAITPDIQSGVDDIATLAEKIEQNQIDNIVEVNSNFNESNEILQHIDSDLHDINTNLGDLLIQFGEGGSINGDTIQNLSESIANQLKLSISPILTNETQKIVDSIDQKFELATSDMSAVHTAEIAGNYLNAEMRSATTQLKDELQSLQYTNINAVVYNYDEYNNYYDLQSYADQPTSNDVFIRKKVQEYIDAVNYATENVKGQITSRLDELKQSTLLTTSYDPEWLVVKAGALYDKKGQQFPDEDWVVDFSKIKLDSDISQSIYDWIYYILACVIIYRQFRKVVD